MWIKLLRVTKSDQVVATLFARRRTCYCFVGLTISGSIESCSALIIKNRSCMFLEHGVKMSLAERHF